MKPSAHTTGLRKFLFALFALGFCPLFQKRHEIDQLLNRQEVIIFAHRSPTLLDRVTWGCHDCMGFNNRFSQVFLGKTRIGVEVRTGASRACR